MEGPQRVSAGLDKGTQRWVHVVRQLVQRRRGHQELLGERAWPTPRDSELFEIRTDMVATISAPLAPSASQHGVAGHSAAYPLLVLSIPDINHHATPLVADPQRVSRPTRVQIGHGSGKQLDIGATQTDPLDVDDRLTGIRSRPGEVLNLGLIGPSDDERPHQRHAGVSDSGAAAVRSSHPSRWTAHGWTRRRATSAMIATGGRRSSG